MFQVKATPIEIVGFLYHRLVADGVYPIIATQIATNVVTEEILRVIAVHGLDHEILERIELLDLIADEMSHQIKRLNRLRRYIMWALYALIGSSLGTLLHLLNIV